MSDVTLPRTYPGEDIESIRRAIDTLQQFTLETDTVRVSANYQVLSKDDLVLVTTGASTRTITLPYVDDAQRKAYYVKKIDTGAGTVVVQGSGSEDIDGRTVTLYVQHDTLAVILERDIDSLTAKRNWCRVPYEHGHVKSIPIAEEQFRKGATAPTDATVGTTPTTQVLLFDATNELASFFEEMPHDWNKDEHVSLELTWSLVSNETNGDTLSITIDYVAIQQNTTGAGLAKTSTQLTPTLDVSTGNGLAAGDIYIMHIELATDDSDNGFAFGDNTIGFSFEIHLTNLDEVASIHLVGGSIDYTAL